MKKLLALIFVMSVLAACASAPTQQEVDTAPIGPYPDNYQALIKANFAQSLFDPYSAVYEFSLSPTRGYAGNRIDGANVGWIVCGTVNAKNRFGAYVGAKPFVAVIRNGSVVHREAESFNAERCRSRGLS